MRLRQANRLNRPRRGGFDARPRPTSLTRNSPLGGNGRQTFCGLAHHFGQSRFSRARRDRGNCTGENVLEARHGPVDPQFRDRIGTVVDLVLMRRLAQRRLVVKSIPQIVGNLKRLAYARAQFLPWFGFLTRSDCPHLGRRDEQSARFGPVIGG